jgi:hypothetical protein
MENKRIKAETGTNVQLPIRGKQTIKLLSKIEYMKHLGKSWLFF